MASVKVTAIMAEMRAANEKALEASRKPSAPSKASEAYSYCLGTGESHAGLRRQPSSWTGEDALNSDWEKEATRLTKIPVTREDDLEIGALPSVIPTSKAIEFLRGFSVFASVDEKVLRQIVTASGVNPKRSEGHRRPFKVTEVFGPVDATRKGPGVLTGVKVPVIWCTCKSVTEGRFCLQHDKSKGRQVSNVRSV